MSIVPVSCGHAHEKYGHKFNVVRRINAGGHGWTHDFSFKAFENQAPNTIPVKVVKLYINHLMPNYLLIYRFALDTIAPGRYTLSRWV